MRRKDFAPVPGARRPGAPASDGLASPPLRTSVSIAASSPTAATTPTGAVVRTALLPFAALFTRVCVGCGVVARQ
jgi:hypothetical protein